MLRWWQPCCLYYTQISELNNIKCGKYVLLSVAITSLTVFLVTILFADSDKPKYLYSSP
jgi:hypothetical protein